MATIAGSQKIETFVNIGDIVATFQAQSSSGMHIKSSRSNLSSHAGWREREREGEKEFNSVHTASWADGDTMECSCQSLTNFIQELQQAGDHLRTRWHGVAYHHWFGRPSKVHCEPYYELPMGITRLRALVQFRIGSHALPVEQGRFARPSLPRHLRRCNLCSTQAVGDELHYVFDCPHFSDIRGQYPALFQDAEGCMRLFVWHCDQKAVSHCFTAILDRAQNVNTDSS